MIWMYIFNLYHIEHSINVNYFRQYFDIRYCLVLWLIFALIILMVVFGHFIQLSHMTYSPATFEAAMSNGLRGNAFTRNK